MVDTLIRPRQNSQPCFKAGRKTHICYYDITGFGYKKPAALQGYSCAISVACGNQRVELSRTVVPSTIPCPKIVRSAYKLANGVNSTASEQAQHPISMNVSPPEANLGSSQQGS